MIKERKIRKEIMGQLKAVSSLFIGGFLLGQGFDLDMNTSVSFIKILILPATIGILTIGLAKWLNRAYVFEILNTSVAAISSLIIFFYMYSYLLLTSSSGKPFLNIGINALLIIITSYFSTKSERNNFEHAKYYNEESGRLNLRTGTWNLEKPLIWDTPERERERDNTYLIAKRLSILLPGMGLILARLLDPSPISLSKFTVLIFAYLIAYGSGRKLNLVAQLLRWEKEIGKPILLSQ